MAYNITEGWYKIWYVWGTDGVNYPYEGSVIAPLYISDTTPTSGVLVENDQITDIGLSFLSQSNISGLVNTITTDIIDDTSVSEKSFNDIRTATINSWGLMNISLSTANFSDVICSSSLYYKAYLDANKTILLHESKKITWSETVGNDRSFASFLWVHYNKDSECRIPTFRVTTDLSTLYVNTMAGRAYPSHDIVNISIGTGSDVSTLLPLFDNLEPYVEDTDPYSKGGDTETGGGTGDFDGTSDDIPIPDLPTLSATSTNFITLFNPSLGELQNLANYMWSDLFDLDTFKKIFADPMDCILGLSIVPVAVPSGGSKAVTVGNISTGVTMQVASAQYVSVDCGTLNVNEYWGAYLDYDPYTKAEIYLPYIGTHPIAVDDIMGKAVHVVYHVDILSGACTAYVQCGGSVLYSFIGQCSASIPITGNDWTNVINGVLSIAGSIGSMVATGGMSAPLTALQAPVTAAKVGSAMATGSSLASTAVNSLKPSVEKSGSMSGVGGMLAVQTPYIILTRPRQARPKQQNTYTGYPSFITSKLSKLTGYTEIEVIHMDGLTCTDAEAIEIESLLKSGVIF